MVDQDGSGLGFKEGEKSLQASLSVQTTSPAQEANGIPKRVSVRNKKVHLLQIPTVVLEDQCTMVHCSKDS